MNMDLPAILILDDDTAVRSSLVDFFQDHGWSPMAVSSGEQALDLLETCAPQAAVVDIRLEAMTGDTFIREALDRHPEMVFVVCTGSPDYEIAEDLRNEPRMSPTIFFKPLRRLLDLEKEVRNMLGQIGAGRND